MKPLVYPFIVGHGRAGAAVHQALAIVGTETASLGASGFEIAEPVWVGRDESLKPRADGISIAFITNPHGLHAERICEADKAGFDGIATEKPACVTRDQAKTLLNVKTKTAVYHVYRQMWGPQTLKEMILSGEMGDLITIEGRYWQASTADRALNGPAPNSWKNNIRLSGPSDTLLDVGTHWADLAAFLAGSFPSRITGWSSYANAESKHRDSHIHLCMEFGAGPRALSSITKNAHGATNHFEVNIFGTKAAATWTFLNPDEILMGRGRERSILTRKTAELGTGHPPFHGAGWLEGYVEITKQILYDACGITDHARRYPVLRESVDMIDALLASEILA